MSKGVTIREENITAARQMYLAGHSYAVIAKKLGIGLRTVKRYGKQGGWEDEWQAIEKTRQQDGLGTDLAPLVEAADQRATVIDGRWKERLSRLIERESANLEAMQELSEKVRGKLAEKTMDTLVDWKEAAIALGVLIRTMNQSGIILQRLSKIVGPNGRDDSFEMPLPEKWQG